MSQTAAPDIAQLSVQPGATLRRVMETIDRGAVEIALVVGEDGTLLGTVTDGDVRRALLAGAGLEEPVGPHMTTDPITVRQDSDRAHVIDLMQARLISQVPVVDHDGRVVGLHLLRAMLGAQPRPNWAVIMAGGLGTRLRPLTETIPKPMVPVAGRPLLERIILHLVGHGIHEIVLSVNYLAEMIEDHFRDGSELGCRIRYVHEDPEHPLGTAGSLALVRELDGGPHDPVLVMNGDIVSHFALHDLLAAHERTEAVVTIAAVEHSYRVPFGVLDVDEADQVNALVEKPLGQWLVNAGVYVLEPALLAQVPGGQRVDMTTVLADAIARGERVSAWQAGEDWLDVGRHDDLRQARGHG